MKLYRVRLRFKYSTYSIVVSRKVRAMHGLEAIQTELRRCIAMFRPCDARLAYMAAFFVAEERE